MCTLYGSRLASGNDAAPPLHRYRDPMAEQSGRALFLNGTVGAGKTTTAEAIGDLLQQRGTPYAVIDLDWLRNAWPAPNDDPFNMALELQNLAAVAANFRRAGARVLVLAGVIETRADRERYERALDVLLTACRLVVPIPRIRSRITARHPPGAERDWHLARIGELDSILESAQLDDFVVRVDDDEPSAVAHEVLRTVGWTD